MQLTNSSGELSLGGLVDALRTFEDATSMSLFQYTKRSTIMSRVYIEKTLAGEEILTPLMMNIMNIYTGLILTALNMNQYVNGSKKVRDAMQVVATEAFDQAPTDLREKMQNYFLGSQSSLLLSNRSRQEIAGLEDVNFTKSDGSPLPSDDPDYNETNRPTSFSNVSDAGIVNVEPKEATLPSGRVISVDFGATNADGKSASCKVNMYLQLLPTFIPSDVVRQFIAMNFTPSVKQRWMQVSAGEISFFKDFLMGQDKRKQRFKALKNDKSGVLRDMIERQENSLSNSWLKLALVTPERQNIANTILIFEKNNFDRACNAAGLKFKDYNSRQKFFNKTFSMIVVTIDPMYNKIEMFYHGLNAMSTFAFDQMRKNAKTEAVDMMTLMKTFANGMAPKF